MAERIVETAMYSKMAKAHPSLERGMVWCRTCGRSERVDSADCLRNGWPTCCHGHTMTIDHPSTWRDSPTGDGERT